MEIGVRHGRDLVVGAVVLGCMAIWTPLSDERCYRGRQESSASAVSAAEAEG